MIGFSPRSVRPHKALKLTPDGAYEILFSAFAGIDFSDIDGIKLLSQDGVLSPDFGISAVKAVPEPATAFLLAGGLAGLRDSRCVHPV